MTHRIIPAYLPEEPEIIRNDRKDDPATYLHTITHDEIHVCSDDLFDLFQDILAVFQTVTELMDNDAYGKYGPVLESIIERARIQMNEAAFCVKKHIGTITIFYTHRTAYEIRSGRIVWAELAQSKGISQSPAGGAL